MSKDPDDPTQGEAQDDTSSKKEVPHKNQNNPSQEKGLPPPEDTDAEECFDSLNPMQVKLFKSSAEKLSRLAQIGEVLFRDEISAREDLLVTKRGEQQYSQIHEYSKRFFSNFFEKKEDFLPEYIIEELRQIETNGTRLLYSTLRLLIGEKERADKNYPDILDTNTKYLVGYVELTYPEETHLKKKVAKIMDHVIMSRSHIDRADVTVARIGTAVGKMKAELDESSDDVTRKINSLDESNKKAVAELEKEAKSLTDQLIALVGLFTAMSFLVFGGLSAIEHIFEGAPSTPLTKMLTLGSLWGIFVYNTIFIFVFYVGKLVGKNMAMTSVEGASVFRKFPITIITNVILVIVFLASLWSHLLWRGEFLVEIETHLRSVTIGGEVILLCAFPVILILSFFIFGIVAKRKRKLQAQQIVEEQKAIAKEKDELIVGISEVVTEAVNKIRENIS